MFHSAFGFKIYLRKIPPGELIKLEAEECYKLFILHGGIKWSKYKMVFGEF